MKVNIIPSSVVVEEDGTIMNEIGLITLSSLFLNFLSDFKVYEMKLPKFIEDTGKKILEK